MSESRWLRLNIDWDDSPWLFTLSAESQLAWIKLLCHVKRDGRTGGVKALAPMVAAKKWGLGEESVVKMLQAAVNDGALESDGQTWQIANWNKYQDVDKTNYERQKRYRTKQKMITDDNGVTTVADRSSCRVTLTETETSKEKYIKKKPSEDECREYAVHLGLTEQDGSEFFNHQEMVGWVYGKSRHPIKDWKRALVTWKTNKSKFGNLKVEPGGKQQDDGAAFAEQFK